MKTLWSATLALLAVAAYAAPAHADLVKCQATISKANSAFLQARVKALAKCEGARVKTGTGSCPDTKAQTAFTKAAAKLASTIDKACGGDDKVCGFNTAHEDTPQALGWGLACPRFEKNGCNNQLEDCGDIATCLTCIGAAAGDQALDLYYDDLLININDKPLNKCQQTIGKTASAFLNAKSKILQKCWAAKLKPGSLVVSCVPPDPGDGKYLAAITKASDKMKTAICKACGGADKLCDGNADITPATIGFTATCPAVNVPNGGPACGGNVTTLAELRDCVDCITSFKGSCTDQVSVPEFAAYPAECNTCTAPTPSGPCPTSFEFTAEGQSVDLDAGFSGLGHNARVPTNGRITLAVSGCAGANQPTCGTCNINGPLQNAGGVEFNNQRCQDASWVQCTNDGDCTGAQICNGGTNSLALCTTNSECPGGVCQNAGYTGPCGFFFGAPLPLVAGGVPTCVLNQINAPVTGTANLDDGNSVASVPLSSKVHPTGTVFNPCPICDLLCLGGGNDGNKCAADSQCPGGVCSSTVLCSDGPRVKQACTVNGTGLLGDVSLDCPPNPGTLAGTLQINLQIATGTQTVTLSAANPNCRETGYNTYKCFCDTCNNANQDACTDNSQCPISGGNPGICGGRRCIGGPNEGAPCTFLSECPSGLCSRPGESTKPNSCQDDTTNVGFDCEDQGGNQGLCSKGPLEKVCSLQTNVSCTELADCNPPTCPDCFPGQTCITRKRACFVDNGVIGNSISVIGSADAPCNGTANPTVGTFFCVAPVAQGAVNAASGLPGLGRVRIPGQVVIGP